MIITIDGPVASGKSTIARDLAHTLNLFYIASGSIYRGLACVFIHYFDLKDLTAPPQDAVKNALDTQKFSYTYNEGKEQISFDDHEITLAQLKTPEIDNAASIMSTNFLVREAILVYIRSLAQQHSVIIDGRDCGSVIFPQADYKFYLTASVDIRAERWLKMQKTMGNKLSLQDAIAIITDRDNRDMQREIAPLIVPQGAIIIDSSAMNENQVTQAILGKIV